MARARGKGSAEAATSLLTLVSFSDERRVGLALLAALPVADRLPLVRVLVRRASFREGLNLLAAACAHLSLPLADERVAGAVAGLGEEQAATARKLLSGRCPLLTAMLAGAASANAADTLTALVAVAGSRQTTVADGAAVIAHFSFDDERRAALAVVLPLIPVDLRPRLLGEAVAGLSFDESRLAVLAEHGASVRQLPRAERERLLAQLAFDQERARAVALLELP